MNLDDVELDILGSCKKVRSARLICCYLYLPAFYGFS